MKQVLEIVYCPEYSTHAYICKDRTIYVMLAPGRCFEKKEIETGNIPEDLKRLYENRPEIKTEHLNIFAAVEEYAKDLFSIKKSKLFLLPKDIKGN